MSSREGQVRRGGLVLFSLALLLDALSAALYVEGHLTHSSAMRNFAFLALTGGIFLGIRASAARDRARRAQSTEGGEVLPTTAAKRSGRIVRIVGIALVILGLALFAAVPLGWGTRLFGLVVAMAGILFSRNSFDRTSSPGTTTGEEAVPKAVERFDRVMRIAGIALVPLMVFSAVALFLTPVIGHAWPLYTFFVVGLASALVWSYLFARFLARLAVSGLRQ